MASQGTTKNNKILDRLISNYPNELKLACEEMGFTMSDLKSR